MPQADALLERIEAFHHAARGEIVVRKVARGYSLFSARTGAPLARLRPTGEADKVSSAVVERRTLGHLRPVRHRHHAARQGAQLHRHRAGLLDPCLIAKAASLKMAKVQLSGASAKSV